MYDHMATLPEEIAFIWRRPKALSAMLFLFNRYLALLSNVSNLVVRFIPLSNKVLLFRHAYTELAGSQLLSLGVCLIFSLVLEYLSTKT
jgi:hypothetical protein